MEPGAIIGNVEIAVIQAITLAESFGSRVMTEDERKLFKLGFIAGVQHGLFVVQKEYETLLTGEPL